MPYPPFFAYHRVLRPVLAFVRRCLVHSFLGYLIAGHFGLPLLTHTHTHTHTWATVRVFGIAWALQSFILHSQDGFWIDLGFLVWDWEIRVSFGWSRRIGGETLGAALAVSSDLHSLSGYYWEFLFILYFVS
jgi:hypothetical protein